MKRLLITVLGVALLAGQACAGEKAVLKDEKDKVSYSIGLEIGNKLKSQAIDINADTLASGTKDALSGSKPLMTEKEIQETMTAFQKEMMAKQAEKTKALAEKNKKEG